MTFSSCMLHINNLDKVTTEIIVFDATNILTVDDRILRE
jgi:hypothetical protein